MSILNSPSRLLVIPEPSTAFHRRSKLSCSANGRPERLQRPLLRSRPSLREPPTIEDSPALVQSPDPAEEDDLPRQVGSVGEDSPSSGEGITTPDLEKPVSEVSRPVMKPRTGLFQDSEETQVQSQVPENVPDGSASLKRPQMKPAVSPVPPSVKKDDITEAISLLSRPERPKVDFPNSISNEEVSSEEIVQNEDVKETVIELEEREAEIEQTEATPPVQQVLIKPKPVAPTPTLDSATIEKTRPPSLQDQDKKLETEVIESEEATPVLKRPQVKPAMGLDILSVKAPARVQAESQLSRPELPGVKFPDTTTDEIASSEKTIKNEEDLAETVIQTKEEIKEVIQLIEATPPLRLTPPVQQMLIKPRPPVTPTPTSDSSMIQDLRPPSLQNQETEFEKEDVELKETPPMTEKPKQPTLRSPVRPERPVAAKPASAVPPAKDSHPVDSEQHVELVSPEPSNESQRPSILQKPPARPVQQKSEDADDRSDVLATKPSAFLKPDKLTLRSTASSRSSKPEVDETTLKLTIENKTSPELDLPNQGNPVKDVVPSLVKPTRPVRPEMPSPEKQDKQQEVTDPSASKVQDIEDTPDRPSSMKVQSEALSSAPELKERERTVKKREFEQITPLQRPEIKRPPPRDTTAVAKSSLVDAIENPLTRDRRTKPQDRVKEIERSKPQLLNSPQSPTRPSKPSIPDPIRPKIAPTRGSQATPETNSDELRATLQRTRSAKAFASVDQDLTESRLDDPISQENEVIEVIESPVSKDRATPDLMKKPIQKTESSSSSIDETDTLEVDRKFIREKYQQNAKQLELIRQKKEERDLKAEEDKRRKMEKQGQQILDPMLVEMRRKARQERQEKRESQMETTEKELIIEVGAEGMSVSDLAQLLAVDPTEVIKTLFVKGVMVTVNQTLDMDSVKVVANEMDVIVTEKTEGDITEQAKKETDFLIDDEECISRPPVVTIMGHVDHGKTSLLDYIRNSKVASGEAGGITQAIGAYTCSVPSEDEERLICFLDTPGHEAFSAMRARGAKLTDIAIIIIAADDGIQPQTTEAINHAQAAEVPMIIAINKVDAPGADPDRIKRQLSEIELLPEEWGGSTPVVCISAKTGQGVQDLLEMITLVSDIQLDLQANPHTSAKGTVVEAHLDKRAGVVCALLVQNGALHVGDAVVSGGSYGKVRSLTNERGVQVSEAGPSIAVQMLGFNILPSAGDIFKVCENESVARSQAQTQAQVLRQQYLAEASGGGSMVTLSSLASADDDEQGLQRFNVILKADTSGSLEAIRGALSKLPQDSVAIRYLHSAAGEVTESDVLLASNADGVIFGFNVPISEQVASEAKQRGVQVKGYSVIYHLLDDVRSAMEGKLSPQEDRVWIGRAEVKAVFESGSRRVAGCRVQEGRLETGSFLQVLRKGKVIFEGSLSSLRKVKDSVQEVGVDQECGVGCDEFSEWKEQDVIRAYYLTEKQARLEDSQASKAIDQDELQELIGS